MRATEVREKIERLLKAQPFRKFVVATENGENVLVEHPENFAYHPATNGKKTSQSYVVLSAGLHTFGSFDAVTNIHVRDTGQRISR